MSMSNKCIDKCIVCNNQISEFIDNLVYCKNCFHIQKNIYLYKSKKKIYYNDNNFLLETIISRLNELNCNYETISILNNLFSPPIGIYIGAFKTFKSSSVVSSTAKDQSFVRQKYCCL